MPFQLQAGADRLHAQMIFFIDHDAERLPPIHDNRAADTLGRVLATDEMALDQHLFVQLPKDPAAIPKTNPAFPAALPRAA